MTGAGWQAEKIDIVYLWVDGSDPVWRDKREQAYAAWAWQHPGALAAFGNAAGRYRHQNDNHDAPLDPNFTGTGRVLTDKDGRYRFVTIKPGAYPWRNHHNAWRPAHIHLSLFGRAFVTRLVTQMYFPGDPLLPFDPIFNSTANEKAHNRLIADFDWDTTVPEQALGYRFDIVLRGRNATPMDK